MAKLAFVNIGILLQPFGDPQVRGFEERIERVFEVAESSKGLWHYTATPPAFPKCFAPPNSRVGWHRTSPSGKTSSR